MIIQQVSAAAAAAATWIVRCKADIGGDGGDLQTFVFIWSDCRCAVW